MANLTSQYTEVDNYATKHLHAQTEELNTALQNATERCRANELPNWDILPSHGKFLMLQARLCNAKRILEIGCLGGHSAIWFASGGPQVHVTTVESNEKFAAVARENLKEASLTHQVELIQAHAKDALEDLQAQIEGGSRGRFEFVFIDADKENNWVYFEKVLSICEPRACIIVHCALSFCDLSIPFEDEKVDRRRGSRELIEKVGHDHRIDSVLFQTVPEPGYHSLMAIVK